MTCPFGTMDWYCCLAAGHAGPHESHELPPDTSTNPPSVPSLDVEACVRLLKDAARRLRDADAVRGKGTNHKVAADVDALASALPGMGKDSERLREMEAERDRVRAVHVRRHERLSAAVGLPVGYSADATIDAAIKIIAAARAAQPQETSADAE